MALSPLFLRQGTRMGRIQPAGWIPPDGSYVLGIGADDAGFFGLLNGGDYIEFSQNESLAGVRFIRLRCRTRPPTTVPPGGLTWNATFRIDGAAVLTIPITGTRTRDWQDIAIHVAGLAAGNHTIAFRLELTGAGTLVDVEIPAFYVDALVLDTTAARPTLGNRDPEPGHTNILGSTNIALDLQDWNASGTDLAQTKVYVNGVLAFDAGVFQAGYNGAGSAHSTIDGGRTRRIVIDPTSAFASQAVVPVRVVSAIAAGLPSEVIDTTYSFTIEDTTTPKLSSAMAIETRRVRVVFDEPMKMTDPAATDDALRAASYTITRQSAPAVDVVVASVEAVSATSVDLVTNIDITPGASYLLTAVGPEDVNGNAIAAPYNTVLFAGLIPSRPTNRRWDLYRMLPLVNRQEDTSGDLAKFIACLQEVTDLMLADIDAWTDIIDPYKADEAFVDAALYGLGNPFPFTLSLVDKRRLIDVLVQIYELKGTAKGIIDVVRFFLGVDITITGYKGEGLILGVSELGVDWILGPSGAWSIYAYEIVAPYALTQEQRDRITTIATYMQPAHTHLAKIVEPAPPPAIIDHVELGLSELGVNWLLH